MVVLDLWLLGSKECASSVAETPHSGQHAVFFVPRQIGQTCRPMFAGQTSLYKDRDARCTKVGQVAMHSLHHLQDLRQLRGLKPVRAQRAKSATGHTHAFEQPSMKDRQGRRTSAKEPEDEEAHLNPPWPVP